jgi:hypothetical protein
MYQTSRSLDVVWSDLFREKIFLVGLIFKIALIIFFIPEIQQEWFVPFIVEAIESPSVSPWSVFINSGGDPLAFPYGPIMLLAHLPSTFLGWIVDFFTGFNYFAGLGFRISLLGADLLLLSLLLQQFEKHWRGLLLHYWLSPIVIFITYWHGQTDLIPIAIFILSISMLRKSKLIASGLILAASVAAKHSMVIILPFIVIYLWFKRSAIGDVYKFIFYFLLTLILLEGLLLFDGGFQHMVLENKEINKIFWLSIPMGEGLQIYILPLVYLLLVYFTWRLRRINYDLLLATLGVAFGTVILLTPAPTGWFLWLSPMLALHYSRGNGGSVILGALFSFVFVIYHFIYSSGAQVIFLEDTTILINILQFFENLQIKSLLNTILVGIVSVIVLQIFRDGIRGSDYYHLGKKPLVIGISGGIGSGKISFTKALADLFGENKVLKLLGEDYANWDKSSPMWKTITRYDPRSSRHFSMISDLRKILNGEWIKRRTLSQETGRFSKEEVQKGHQVILISGLHALYSKQLVDMQDVGFFLDSEEDCKENILDQEDVEKYIQPQAAQANVVYKLSPINSEIDNGKLNDSRVQLNIKIQDGAYYQELLRVLIGVCGLQVGVDELDEYGNVQFTVQGEIQSEDIRFASIMVVPHLSEFINQENGFCGGMMGVMQLVALMEIDEILKIRRRR